MRVLKGSRRVSIGVLLGFGDLASRVRSDAIGVLRRYSCNYSYPTYISLLAKSPDPFSRAYPEGPSTQIVGFQGPKTTQSMDFRT